MRDAMTTRQRGPGTVVRIVLATAVVLAVPAGRLGRADGVPGAPGPALPEGMDGETIQHIDQGLKYLAATQRPNGSWFSGGGYQGYPVAMTSLAGLALMAGGSTPESGPYAKEVTKAMHFLLNVSEAHGDWLIAGPGGESRSMHGHGFAMLFLAQCYGTELDTDTEKRLKKALDKAVKLTAQSQSDNGAQHQHAGGWYYQPRGNHDEGSVTVTQLQALRACRNAGIQVPKSTIDRAVLYLKICQQADGGICYRFGSRGSRPPISAAAIACFYAAGVYDRQAGGTGDEAKMVDRLIKYCKSHAMPVTKMSGHMYYGMFYLSQALYQRGGKDWDDYYPTICRFLYDKQSGDGSWQGDSVGRTYGTAIATIVLQLPYGYLPIYQR